MEQDVFEGYAARVRQRGCEDPAAFALYGSFMLLQEKWVLFIVHSLADGPLGFNELGRRAFGVNTTTLAQRLDLLERAGVVTRTVERTIPPKTSYELTRSGRALHTTVIGAIAEWSRDHVGEHGPRCGNP